jgi:hypothetical protein
MGSDGGLDEVELPIVEVEASKGSIKEFYDDFKEKVEGG